MEQGRQGQRTKLDDELIAMNQRSIEDEGQQQEVLFSSVPNFTPLTYNLFPALQVIYREQDIRLDALHQVTGRLTEMSVEMGNELDSSTKFAPAPPHISPSSFCSADTSRVQQRTFPKTTRRLASSTRR
jgi:hypothetical protein